MKNAVILGASGYTGAEAVRLILQHPKLKLVGLTGHSRAGQEYADVYPNFAAYDLPTLTTIGEVDWKNVDVAFACLPHGASQEAIASIQDKVETIIDLSADFRLSDPDLYAATYGRPHAFPDMLKGRVYGLTEFAREELRGAKLVACPGCYPTCSLLALLPGIQAGMFTDNAIIIDAKSGVTGAGRKTSAALLYSEITDGAHAYGVATHRHAPEIEQGLSQIGGQVSQISFTPHLVPMNRGMIATCYVELTEDVTAEDLRDVYVARYADDPFVHVEPAGTVPQTRHIRASNYARIGVFADRVPGRAIIISVIDNLTKGSSGQAIQNYNLTQGWDETLGLMTAPVFP
ncbi:N-acetyl-gamma-glutamyl-phosphate reductase [Litorimonas sp. RW-G-Af-16]|uniref:N-acetyl-gamma-glutamyl-phosphate reductase n=1 Tax=Litorimonas sp. RW-G-Af-16 TaxID=3241168 RepID=UPI00390C4B28